MTRAERILAVYDYEVRRFRSALGVYVATVEVSYPIGTTMAVDRWAGIVRRRAAAVEATIGEVSPECSA